MKKTTVLKYSLAAVLLTALLVALFAFSLIEVTSPMNEANTDDATETTTLYTFMQNDDGTFTQVEADAASWHYLGAGSVSPYDADSRSNSASGWGKCSCSCSCESYDSKSYTIPGDWQDAARRGRLYVQITFSSMSFSASGNSSTSTSVSISGGVTTSRGSGNGNAFGSYEQMSNSNMTIYINFYAYASSSASAKAVFKCSCSCSCSTRVQGTATIYCYYDRPSTSFTNQNSSCGSITNSGSHTMDYNTTQSSKATAATNCYFKGWSISDVSGRSVSYNPTETSPNSRYISSSESPEFSADFGEITGSNWNTSSYTYNGSAQGPYADSISGYTVSHSYTGTLLNGTSYSSSSRPTNAGTYNYTATVSRGGYTLGSRKSVQFKINKDTNPQYTFTNPSGISFGQPLSRTGISATQPTNSQSGITIAGSWNWRTNTIAAGGSIISADTLYNSGSHGLYFTFVPSDSNNYNPIERYVTVTVTRAFTVNATFAEGTNPKGNTCSTVSNASTSIVNNKAVVTLTAYPDTANNYVLLGWMRGGVYNSGTDFSNNTITYTFTDSSDAQICSVFQARFIQYTVDEEVQKTKSFPYTGAAKRVTFGFDLDSASHPYRYSSVTYDGQTSGPISVGNHTASVAITNTALNRVVATVSCTLVITPRNLVVKSQNVNEAGWSQGPSYNISTEGAVSGAVDYYMYSTNNGSTWTKIDIAPATTLGCAITFTPPSFGDNVSKIVNYTFIAVNNSYGSGNPKAVSNTGSVSCRIDTYIPQISVNYAAGSDGNWVNKDVSFSIDITYGGSGAQVLYSINGGSNWNDTGLVGITPVGVTLGSDNPSASFTWTRTDEQDYKYIFRIISGTDKSTEVYVSGTSTYKEFSVRIDKSAPVLSDDEIDKSANALGWINETTISTFTATDNNLASNSGFKSITVNHGDAQFILNSGSMNALTNDCYLTISDCRTYVITATDYAGNVTTKTIQYDVDIVTPEFGYDEGSYAVGEWDTIADFLFAINAGGSGIRISYSTDNIIFKYFDGKGDFYKEVGNESGHEQVVRLNYAFTEEQIQDYYFRVECAAGFSSQINFGTVKVDTYAPTIYQLNIEDFTSYEWETGEWGTETLRVKITTADDQGVQKSGVKTIKMDDGIVVADMLYDDGEECYYFDIVKCTIHTLSVTDEAGNVTSFEYRYKVDQGTPDFEYEATIGSTGNEYTFDENSWLSEILYGEDAFVRFKFDLVFSPSGVKMQYCVDETGSVWKDFASDAFMVYQGGTLVPLTLAAGGYIFEPGNENGLEQRLTVYIDVKNEQDNPFRIKMITGSNKVVDKEPLGWLRLDFTAPNFYGGVVYTNEETGASISTNDINNKWRADLVRTTFTLKDATSGVASVAIRKYASDAVIAFPVDSSTPYEAVELVDEGDNKYHYIMDEYSKYVYVIVDKAGNISYTYAAAGNYHPYILPKIDTFSEFSVDVAASYTSNGTAYTSGTWIFNSDENVRFDFSYDVAAFGPSGATIQFSVNGGNTWIDAFIFDGVEQRIVNNGTMNPYMIASATQMRNYLFRVITGAGNYDIYDVDGENAVITVNKEIVDPNLTIVAKKGADVYDSTWVNADIVVGIEFAVGVSGMTLQYATAGTPDAEIEESAWTTMREFGESSSSSWTQTIAATTNELYYYYRFVSGSGRTYVARTNVIRIDRDAVSATLVAYVGAEKYDGAWTANSIVIKLEDLICGPSGHTTSYQTSAIGAGIWGDFYIEGIEDDALTIYFNDEVDYRFKVVSGSGITAITNLVTIRCDVVVPTFDIIITNGTELTENVSEVNMHWWTTNIDMEYQNSVSGRSGYEKQYCYSSDDGVTWTEWTSNGINDASQLILRDIMAIGGTQSYYKFRLINGAGVTSVEKDFRNNVVPTGSLPEIVKIDNKTYTVKVTQFIDTISNVASGINFATVNGTAGTFNRGKTVNVFIVFETGLYGFNALEFTTGGSYADVDEPTSGGISFSVEIQGENVAAVLRLNKLISIVVDNLSQKLQLGDVTAVGVTVDEDGFTDIFGEIGFEIRYAPSGAEYDPGTSTKDNYGSSEIPQQIGVYDVRIFSSKDCYVINDNYAQLTVIYFDGDGIATDTAYKIANYRDFSYIDYYMNPDEAYNFLGSNRQEALFYQVQDIDLTDIGFAPIAGITSPFGGQYEGNNHKFIYNGTYTVTGNFGLFLYLREGASVSSIGVEIDKLYITDSNLAKLSDEEKEISEEYNIGMVASYAATGALISAVYAIGDIQVENVTKKVNIGGIVGNGTMPYIAGTFTDVQIRANNISKTSIGGIIGKSDDLVFVCNYSIGDINVTNFNKKNSYVGALIGFINGELVFSITEAGVASEVVPSVFLKNNIIVDRELYTAMGVGNADQAVNVSEGMGYAVFDYFLSEETVIGNEESAYSYEGLMVKELSMVRFTRLNIEGSGTESDPILVNTVEQFKFIDQFPWAAYKQNAELLLSGDVFEEVYDLFVETVFSGVYDGTDHSIIAPSITVSDYYVGVFPNVKFATIKNIKLLDYTYNVSGSFDNIYVGGLIGKADINTNIYNIITSGTLNVEGDITKSVIFAGGIVGDFRGKDVSDSLSAVTVSVNGTYMAAVGGLIGQASGEEGSLNNLVSLAKVSANYTNSGFVGSVVGYIYQEVSGKGLYNVPNNTYVNGRLNDSIIGENESNGIKEITTADFERTSTKIDISSIIKGLYPFKSGKGTSSDPFIISTYSDLLRISDYMYASFRLSNSITIGDYDGDGNVDDDYTYDFVPLGGTAVFTGSLDGGDQDLYSIYNLTDSLFTYNAGTVKNIKLNVFYRATTDVNVAAEDPRAKLQNGKDIIFGAVAKYNRTNGNIKNVTVDGTIKIEVAGRYRVKVGGIVGVSEGGLIRANICAANIKVDAYVVDVGGMVGSVEGSTNIANDNEFQFNFTVAEIIADGGLINAGLIIGALRSKAEIEIVQYYTPVTVCGEALGTAENPQYIGVNTAGATVVYKK